MTTSDYKRLQLRVIEIFVWYQNHVVIRGHSWSLVAIRGHSWSLVVTDGHWWPFVVTRGHSWPFVVTRGVHLEKRLLKQSLRP